MLLSFNSTNNGTELNRFSKNFLHFFSLDQWEESGINWCRIFQSVHWFSFFCFSQLKLASMNSSTFAAAHHKILVSSRFDFFRPYCWDKFSLFLSVLFVGQLKAVPLFLCFNALTWKSQIETWIFRPCTPEWKSKKWRPFFSHMWWHIVWKIYLSSLKLINQYLFRVQHPKFRPTK